ncbi:MAG TPA: hypothetical protein VGI72_03040 [Gaiellales bacterium]
MNPRRIAVLSLALLSLWPAAPAAAKFMPVHSARACGPTGCVPLPAGMVSQMLGRFEGGDTGNPGMRLGPFYRLHIRPQPGPSLLFYVPVSRMIVVNGQTLRVGRHHAARLDSALRDLQPIPPRIESVTVGAHPAAHPLAYMPLLFGRPVYPPASVWNHRDVLIAIDLAGESPWSYWGGAEYFPSVRLLHVPDGVWVRVGAAQAAMIASDLHPGGRAGHGGSASPATVAAVVAVAIAIAAMLVVALRRRPWRRARVA